MVMEQRFPEGKETRQTLLIRDFLPMVMDEKCRIRLPVLLVHLCTNSFSDDPVSAKHALHQALQTQ